MKLDKESVIVVLACAILIGVWGYYYPRWQAEKQIVPAAVPTASVPAVPPPAAAAPAPVLPAAPVPALKKEAVTPGAYVLFNDYVRYSFDSAGAIGEIEFTGFRRTGDTKPVTARESTGHEPLTVTLPGFTLTNRSVRKYSDTELECCEVYGKQAVVTKRFTLPKDASTLSCRVTITSPELRSIPSVYVWAGELPPLKSLSGDDLRDIHQAEFRLWGNGSVRVADATAKPEKFLSKKSGEPLEWVAVSNKYFLSLLSSRTPFSGGCDLTLQQLVGKDGPVPLPGIAGVYSNLPLPTVLDLSFYGGVKDLNRMKYLPESASGAIHLAYWGWLEPLCRPMLALLNKLKDWTGSYGLAIILLTVLVKLVLWPLIHKGNKSMRKLQKLQPELKELKEKYKDNQQEFSIRMAELYKREKVNPLGGCLPMLLQLPVFIALYSTLDSAVELRHVPFLWCTDLSRPDLVGPPLIFGYGIHPLMLLSTGLMVLQMKLSPQVGDPAQQKMMMLMPIMMLFFFYNFPSGLALYWCVNNVFSILQMKYSQYSAAREDARKPGAPNGAAV